MEKRCLKSHPSSMFCYLERHDYYRVRDCDCHYYYDTCFQNHNTSMTETGCKKLLQKEMEIWGPLTDLFEKTTSTTKVSMYYYSRFPFEIYFYPVME